MRTRVKGRCQLKLTTLGAAKVCFLKENGIARVCEAHFYSFRLKEKNIYVDICSAQTAANFH